MAFNLEMYPIVYMAQYHQQTKRWDEKWHVSDHVALAELQKMNDHERQRIFAQRNNLPLPGVSYTNQYGYGCFEGMKAFPQKNGGVALFRPQRNAERFANSMRGMMCEPFPPELYLAAIAEFIRKNAELGYVPAYNAQWENDNYSSASAVYLRPFMNSEGAIGVGIAHEPIVIICATTVSSYFKGGNTKAITTKRVRAMPFGTGVLKCSANYVISALAKKEAENAGYMEVIFLDGCERKYVQEGSSCNIFFLLKNGTLITPEIGDTILPGITRSSVIDLARERGITVEERLVTLAEILDNSAECFVTGTAAGLTPIESITHENREHIFNNREIGNLTADLQKELKGIQYGLLTDKNAWRAMVNG